MPRAEPWHADSEQASKTDSLFQRASQDRPVLFFEGADGRASGRPRSAPTSPRARAHQWQASLSAPSPRHQGLGHDPVPTVLSLRRTGDPGQARGEPWSQEGLGTGTGPSRGGQRAWPPRQQPRESPPPGKSPEPGSPLSPAPLLPQCFAALAGPARASQPRTQPPARTLPRGEPRPLFPLPRGRARGKAGAGYFRCGPGESQNHEGWKRPPRSSSPTATPSPPRLLNRVPKCHIHTVFEPLQGQ